jgi:hypothetical protein
VKLEKSLQMLHLPLMFKEQHPIDACIVFKTKVENDESFDLITFTDSFLGFKNKKF